MRSLPTHPRPDDGAPSPGDVDVSPSCDTCGDCLALPERRRFVRDVVGLAAALVALGAGRAVHALPVSFTAAPHGSERGRVARYPVPAADGVQIDRDAEVILVRARDAVYAFNLACPHQRVAIRWLERDRRFQCPKHKSKYRPDGTFIEGRATRGLDRFAIARDGTAVVVDLETLHKQDADPAGWSAAVVHLA